VNKKVNILFLGGAKRVSLAEKFIGLSKETNSEINVLSYELNDEVPIGFVAKVVIGLKWNDEKLYDHLKETIKTYEINIVIPFLDTATLIAAKLRTIISNDIFIPVSELELSELFFNKIKANEWCIKNNIPVPNDITTYPLIAKPITGSASKGLVIIQNNEQLDKLENKGNFLIQKFIKGKEFSVDIYVSPNSKEIISMVVRERLETQGGESIKSITVKDANLISFCEDIINKSKLIGPLTLQVLKENESGKLYFMEINPRFGGAVLNSIEAGANSPLYLINDYLGIKNERNDNWQNNLLMIRRFTEYYKLCK
jgi:carbamoyl-phosphate synthase large subunit